MTSVPGIFDVSGRKKEEQKRCWRAKQPISKDAGSYRLFYVLPMGVCCCSSMIISQLILHLGPRTVQTDCTVNISMLSLGQFLHSFRRMKQTLPVSFPLLFPLLFHFAIVQINFAVDNFCGAAHYPGMKLALRLPPVCLRAGNKRRRGRKRERDRQEIEIPTGTVLILNQE